MYDRGKNQTTIQTPLGYALSIWRDTRKASITREEAGAIADALEGEGARLPASMSADWIEGWEAACQALSLALRFKDFNL